MIKIQLSANDSIENKEHTLKVDIGENTSIIHFDYYHNQEYSFNTEDLIKIIYDYTDNYASGKVIQERELYKQFDLAIKNKLDRDLARIFIISSRWIHFGHDNYKDIIFYSFKDDNMDIFLNDANILEWTGDIGVQKGIYFIKKEYVTDHKEAIKKFYDFGLLYKYLLNVDDLPDFHCENYIFPFIEDNQANIQKFALMAYNNIWDKIIRDRKIDLVNLVNGTRHKR